jgi:hypothetical protein
MEQGIIKTGMDYILQERDEQINKHGYSVQHAIDNPEWYDKKQLLQAADFCLIMDENDWPKDWNDTSRDKIINKDRIGQLACAGAFYKAHDEIFGTDHRVNIELCASIINSLLRGESV